MSTLNSAKKKMGRPPVDTQAVNVRMERELVKRIDEWRSNDPDLPSRPEAIRRLVELGLNRSSD